MLYRVLTVDEYGITGIKLGPVLKKLNIITIDVKDEIEAEIVLKDRGPEINAIIWTVNTPGLGIYETIKKVKAGQMNRKLPIIVISQFTGKNYIIKAIESGVAEFLAKPYGEETAISKISKALGISFEKPARKTLDEDIVTFDFDEWFGRELKAAARGAYPLTIMLATITTGFNDAETNEEMNELAGTVNRVIKTKLRETDSTFHYGIDSLLMLLPFANKSGAVTVEEKVKQIFNTHSMIKQKNRGYKLNISYVVFPDDGKVKEKLLEKLENSIHMT